MIREAANNLVITAPVAVGGREGFLDADCLFGHKIAKFVGALVDHLDSSHGLLDDKGQGLGSRVRLGEFN